MKSDGAYKNRADKGNFKYCGYNIENESRENKVYAPER